MTTTRRNTKKIQRAAEFSDTALPEPAEEAIAKRAYEIYLARGADDGNDLADWLQAEGELRTRHLAAE